MNRDDLPTAAAIAVATGELMVAARRTVRPGMDLAAAVTEVRAAVTALWPGVMPEAARDVMATAAQMACQYGVTDLPAGLLDHYWSGQLDSAEGLLQLAREHAAADWPASWPEPQPGPPGQLLAFASSVAFDRAEDEETLTSLSALLALAHLELANREAHQAADLAAHQAAEPGPADD